MNSLSRLKCAIQISIVFLFVGSAGCKKSDNLAVVETGTVVDVENNSYATMKIGNHWWMTENLKVKKYRNGSSVQFISSSDSLSWVNASSGAYCQYGDNPNSPGLLYNWFAVIDTGGLAPAGWHVASDEDWKQLEKDLGMSSQEADKLGWRGTHEGEKMKTSGPENWAAYGEVWSTNESGFSATAGGCRLYDGSWSSPTGLVYTGFWWTGTDQVSGHAWYRYLDYKKSTVFRSHMLKSYGCSVRCVKND